MALLAALALAVVAGWTAGASLDEPRTEVAAAVLRGEIVVVGGFLESGANSRRVDAYAAATDTWRRLPDLPVSVDHAAAASYRGRLVVVGGYGADRRPLRAAFLYDGTRWRRLPPPPAARAAAAAAATKDGRVYVVGGRDERGLAREMLVLDLRTLRWRAMPGPTPREHLAATAFRGRVVALGGRTAGYDTNVRAVEAFDQRRGRWQALPPLPAARGGTGAATIAGRIVSVGGEQPAGTIASVYALRVDAGRWERLDDLPTPRHGLGVVAHAGRVWALAGGPRPGLTVSGVVESLAVP
ncbi:MAG: galactose oxidase [Thermoleophilia bacterium]|nr:galactose oxidase [Thermoleophilia bacterium]MDH4346408.1 galactose oxidase [Thermoleophilia bacterium]MDH5332691.1 galactose oxidase [Thermoleophilia bacterium]